MSRLTINSNIPSLNAQRSLGNATKKLGDSYTRLSSGLRINKASDDAAGLSISESLKADTRLFNQGVRNLNDGLSLLNVADGALNELTNIVTRLSELAEQSANGTLGNKQRLSLDQEAQSLSKEYNRIARSTEFNGRKIFNGDFGDLSLAAGGNASSLITDGLGGAIGDGSFKDYTTYQIQGSSSLQHIDYSDINSDGFLDIAMSDYNTGRVYVSLANGDGSFKSSNSFLVVGQGYTSKFIDINQDSKKDLIVGNNFNTISVLIGNNDGTFNAQTTYAITLNGFTMDFSDINGDGAIDMVSGNNSDPSLNILFGNTNGTFKSQVSISTGISSYDVKLRDLNGDGIVDLINTSIGNSQIKISLGNGDGTFRNSVSLLSSSTRTSQIIDMDNDGKLDIISAGNTIFFYKGNGDGTFKSGTIYNSSARRFDIGDINGDGIVDILSSDLFATNKLYTRLGNSDGSFNAVVSINFLTNVVDSRLLDTNNDGVLDIVSNNGLAISVYLGNSNSGVSALQSFSLKTQQDSQDSITYLRKTLNLLSNQRGEIGAFQSRVETGVSNLQQSSLAYSEANSRITDIDVAEESSRLAATQILQRSAASILAQANQQPQLVLSLLRDL